MDPALVARIESSLRGRSRWDGAKGGAPIAPRLVAVARFAVLGAIAFVAFTVVSNRHRDRQELQRARMALLDSVRAQAASLTAEDTGSVARAESWLVRSSGSYEGDLVADELRPRGA